MQQLLLEIPVCLFNWQDHPGPSLCVLPTLDVPVFSKAAFLRCALPVHIQYVW